MPRGYSKISDHFNRDRGQYVSKGESLRSPLKKKKNTIRGGTGKNAGEAVTENVSNVTASARAGLKKTKATLEEKVL
ncbi:hypothetical protein CK203_035207 [Vitis vinifera]|uniref:Uncharacterized protein n=1 Tax=Vitis vinifera TaxID=29760 RepID=A0A438HAK2_VITVI|nr:hypothetical protein CK203_035207 [Vitis vinifera]